MNSSTSNYEMFFREYDPALGRMNAVDPMASKYASLTPYNYAFNDPVFFNDPMGDDAHSSTRGGYSYASMGGCGCWRDSGPQDAHAGSGGMYGSSFEASGGGSYTMLANPGFTNAGAWSMIWKAWNSMAGINNGVGRFIINDGELLEDKQRIIDIGRGLIVSGNFGSADWRSAAGMLITGIINDVSRNGGWEHTVAGKEHDLNKFVKAFAEIGIPILGNAIMLPDIEIRGNRMSASEWTRWVNATGGVVGAFGAGNHITLRQITHGSTRISLEMRNAYLGAKTFKSVLNWGGKVFAVPGAINAINDFRNEPNWTTGTKAVANTLLIFAKSTPAGFIISTGYTVIEANGGVEWLVNQVSSGLGPKK